MMSFWITTEILDLEAMMIGISRIEKMSKEREKLIHKIDTDNAEIQNLTEGKTTFKTLFKSRQARLDLANNLKTTVARNRVIVETYRIVINGLTVFMDMKEIPSFKIWKTSQYYKSLTTFCVEEISGHKEIMELWNKMLGVLQVKEQQWERIKPKINVIPIAQNPQQNVFNIEVCEQNNYPERNQQLDAGKIRESDYLKYSYNPHAHNEEHNNYEYHPYQIDEEDEKQVESIVEEDEHKETSQIPSSKLKEEQEPISLKRNFDDISKELEKDHEYEHKQEFEYA